MSIRRIYASGTRSRPSSWTAAKSGHGAGAYVSGSLGTLIGADLLNLDALRGLGAPVASIGGAGTFEGIFLTGIMAVLFVGISRRA